MGGDGHGPDRGDTLDYRTSTDLLDCMRIMGDEAYCRRTVLGESPDLTPPQPVLEKTTVNGPRTQTNGGYQWGVRWSLRNATASTNGWIVQRLTVTQNVMDAASGAITPGQGGYGGFPAADTPYWEGWQVRGGQVFVGASNGPHSADTFSQSPVGPNTRGSTTEAGAANFYPNLTLPAQFQVHAGSHAGALPMTTTDPGLIGGTGPLAHTLTASWNSVTGDGTTTTALI